MRRLLQLSILFIMVITVISCGGNGNSTPKPEITNIQPDSGPPGTMLTVKGKGFQPHASDMSVGIGSSSATVISATKDQIQAEVPEGASSGPVKVTVGGETATGPQFTVETKAPGISSVNPDSGTVGTEVTIKGMNFSATTSENSISFNGTSATVKGATEDQLLTEVPQGAADGPIKVTVEQKSTTGPDFDVITDGTIQIITQTSGSDKDSDGYTVSLDGSSGQTIGINTERYMTDIEEGTHDLELTGLANNCSLSGNNPRTLSIAAGDTTKTTFEVSCQAKAKSKIVFESDRDGNQEIYIMDADGSNHTRLTNNSAIDGSPVISNDGKTIVFSSDRNGDYDLYKMNADGSDIQRLTHVSNLYEMHASWSPDDSQIAFDAVGQHGYLHIYTMSSSGSNQTPLTDDKGNDKYPSWSPDGTKIVFYSDRLYDKNDPPKGDDIFTVTVQGHSIQAITENDAENTEPRWSPDGSKIAFVSNNNADNDFEIYVAGAQGGGAQRITDNSSPYDSYPSWSPDGTRLVFSRNGRIYKIASDGSGTATSLSNNKTDGSPYWGMVK
ncbi:IPT/TIG domain-containing protein [Fodinibius halophilus]|uniref:IPT/TIG domain-containing protein n=1 Tax=Fodinibius halophilus TaxID=1736908 RepID=A0A6M1T6F8_9BACT|nr:IPT/TIG domain-containing protein [Fodinibius halophilus]NGP88233.1 hypothetical protein [Fodinibius halophilus]